MKKLKKKKKKEVNNLQNNLSKLLLNYAILLKIKIIIITNKDQQFSIVEGILNEIYIGGKAKEVTYYLKSKAYVHLNAWREVRIFPILKSQGRRLLDVILEANEQFRVVHLK